MLMIVRVEITSVMRGLSVASDRGGSHLCCMNQDSFEMGHTVDASSKT